MQSLRVVVVLLAATGCAEKPGPGPAVLLSTGASDPIIINSRWPKPLPVHGLDAKGRIIAGAPIRFTRASGAEFPVANDGTVTCAGSEDLSVRADLGSLTTNVLVRCQPVEYVRIQGPIQFVLGDSDLSRPRPFSVGVYNADWQPVSPYTADITLLDSRIATLAGTTLTPLFRGKTVLGVHVGDGDGQTGVHIYQRVEGLDALDTLLRIHPDQRFFAVPLRLESGTQFRHRLPPGHWMLSLLPHEEQGRNPIRLGVDSAGCESNILNDPGRLGCETGSHSSLVVYRPSGGSALNAATGYLLVGWSGNPWPKRFVPRVPARSGSLACVQQRLSEHGYEVRQVSDDHPLFRAERREARLGTEARREWIEFQVAVSDSSLRGRAWAVDSYPRSEGLADGEDPLVVDPTEVTVTDAREALQACGRGT